MKLHRIADLYVAVDYKYPTMINQAPKYETDDKPQKDFKRRKKNNGSRKG